MKCATCNNHILSGEAFCGQCGSPVPSIVPLSPSNAQLCPSCSANNPLSAKQCRLCGSELKRLLGQGQKLRGYQIETVLGCGGFSAVYRATKAGQPYALKEICIRDAAAQSLFDFEAQIMAAFSHDNLPEFFERFSTVDTRGQGQETRSYIVMEFIEGETLSEKIETEVKNGTFLQESVVLSWGIKLCDVLEALHQHAIVHRDIKPENIKITPAGALKLIDFGIAKVHNPLNSKTQTNARGFGSQGYAPPEQYTGKTDARSDIYALGATLYHLLTNYCPVDSSMRAASIQELKPIRHLNPRVSRELESAILKAMSLKADERYVSMRDFREALAGHVRQQLFECPRCRVINDPNASACASCGARFKHLETFIMRNGEKIVGIENFAQVCDKHWDDAIYHFENGDFEAWLAAAGRGDLKAIMQQCRRKEASADFALEMFLHQAKLVKTKRKPFRLAQGVMIRRLADIGERCDENWEALKGAFHDREMERWLLSWNRQDLIDLQASIKANIEDPDIAFETFLEEAALVKRPRIKAELAECWDTVPADTPKKQAITIENLSRGWLFGKIRLLKRLPGLKLSSDTFSGNRACVHLHLDTSACKAQKTYQTKVRIESNGGIIDLPVRFRVERAWADFWRSIGLWALLFGLTTGLLRLGLYALGYNQYLGSTSVTFWHLRQLVSLPISAVVAGGIAGGAGLIALLNRIGRSLRWYLIIPLTVLSWVGISGAFIWGGINSYYGLVWALQRVGVGIEWGDQLWRLLTPWGLMGMSAGVCFGLLRQTKRYGQWWLLPSAIVLPVVVWLMLLHYGQGNYLTQLQGAIIHVLEGLKKTALSYKL